MLEKSLYVIGDLCQYYPQLRVAVNVSASEFSGVENLLGRVPQALEKSGLPADALEIELTETALLSHPEHASALIEKFM